MRERHLGLCHGERLSFDRVRNGSHRFCELTENGRDIETDRSRIRSVNEVVDPSLEIRRERSINWVNRSPRSLLVDGERKESKGRNESTASI